jgi:hypothetical protein
MERAHAVTVRNCGLEQLAEPILKERPPPRI